MNTTRHLLFALLLAAAPLAAGDDDRQAAELFYRAFWLEQAAGDAEQAETLYARVVDEFPDAPETPRAILGLVRLRSVRGEDVAGLVSMLEGEWAERARALAGRGGDAAFNERRWRTSGEPVKRELARIHVAMQNAGLDEPDRRFAVEAGAAAHPMLRSALFSLDYERVWNATGILLEQRDPRARAVVLDALRADDHPFRYAVLHALAGARVDDRELLEAVAGIARTGSPGLREDAWDALRRQVAQGSEAADVAWEPLARALREGTPDARRNASELEPLRIARAPAVYVRALLERMEAGDEALHHASGRALVLLAGFEGHADPVERIVAARGPSMPRGRVDDLHVSDEGWRVMVRGTLRWLASNPDSVSLSGPSQLLRTACARSPGARIEVVEAALERESRRLLLLAKHGDPPRLDLDGQRERLQERALELGFRKEDRSGFALWALSEIGIGAEDAAAIVAVLRAHPDAPLDDDHLQAIGGALFEPQVYRLLLERLSPEWMRPMLGAARGRPELAELFARRVLDLRGEEWRWNERASQAPGPVILISANQEIAAALRRPPLRDRLLEHVDDDRRAIAQMAVQEAVGRENALALADALDSPFPDLQEVALKHLDDPGTIAAYLRNAAEPPAAGVALNRLREVGTPQQAAVAQGYVEAGGEHLYEAWRAWLALAPEPATSRALVEVFDGPRQRRWAALAILTHSDDPRRIDVFRKLLTDGAATADVRTVVQAVGEQYLIELGPEVVEQLRNPDDGIRNAATRAIEHLKFYAEARNLFKRE